MATCGLPERIEEVRPVSTLPGPHSTKMRAPASYMAWISSAKRTGRARWSASKSRVVAGSEECAAAVVFENTTKRGGFKSQAFNPALSGPLALATRGEWNAHATGTARALI